VSAQNQAIKLPRRNDFHDFQRANPLLLASMSNLDHQQRATPTPTTTTGSGPMPVLYQSDFPSLRSLSLAEQQGLGDSLALRNIDYTNPNLGQHSSLLYYQSPSSLSQIHAPGSFGWLANELGEEDMDFFISLFNRDMPE
jgi:hypothetical protein